MNIGEEITLSLVETPEARSITGTINGADRNGILRLTLPRTWSEGTRVRLQAASNFWTVGRVLYSLPKDDVFQVTIQTDPLGQRREPRIEVDEEAQIVSVESQPHSVNCSARVVDVSRSGLGFVSKLQFQSGMAIEVKLKDALVFGTIRHCAATPGKRDSFKTGLEIETVILRDLNANAGYSAPFRRLWEAVATVSHGVAKQMGRGDKS